jgi:flagella basal body P-ring formation protein FlgA
MIRVLALVLLALPARADSVVATRIIRAQTVIAPEDITTVAADMPGAITTIEGAVGQETKILIYPGRAVRAVDLGAPARVERNQIIPLIFRSAGLSISTEGRALARGAVGDVIAVLNLSTRSKVLGRIGEDGTILVSQTP